MVKTHTHTRKFGVLWKMLKLHDDFFSSCCCICVVLIYTTQADTHIPSLFSLFWFLSRLSSMWCVFFCWVWMSDSCFFRNVCFEWPPLLSLALSFWTLFSIYSVTKQRVSSGKLSRHLYAIVWGQSYAYRIVSACEKAKASSSLWCLFSFAAQL